MTFTYQFFNGSGMGLHELNSFVVEKGQQNTPVIKDYSNQEWT